MVQEYRTTVGLAKGQLVVIYSKCISVYPLMPTLVAFEELAPSSTEVTQSFAQTYTVIPSHRHTVIPSHPNSCTE